MLTAIWVLAVVSILCSVIVNFVKENTFFSDLLCNIAVIIVAVMIALILIHITPKIFL